ncbi:trypsin [Dictyocaulus viviparus]|uniref:Trypsin n=1 Tax=Dictyocaulus viviparus TaxID=29172 RepID=A0A0D8X6F7_DICVI|nr:trypsin [Dictyocaulus viviparus]
MIKSLLLFFILLFLPVNATDSSDDSHQSFYDNLDLHDQQSLHHNCGEHFLTEGIQFRSLGSVVAKDNEYPWTLGIRRGSGICSAVLISTRHVLTAAHCVFVRDLNPKNAKSTCPYKMIRNSQLLVYPGTKVKNLLDIPKSITSYSVVNKTVHPEYDFCKGSNDVALLEISPSMLFDGSPICMPSANEGIPKDLTSTGFGFNPDLPADTRSLQAVNLTHKGWTKYGGIVTSTKDKMPCSGDSGGPLFKVKDGKYILVGIGTRSEDCMSALLTPHLSLWFNEFYW